MFDKEDEIAITLCTSIEHDEKIRIGGRPAAILGNSLENNFKFLDLTPVIAPAPFLSWACFVNRENITNDFKTAQNRSSAFEQHNKPTNKFQFNA